MKTILHKATTRGHANHGWLDSHHTFSFAGYYDTQRIHFGVLRVLNDDVVQGGAGFGTHPHDNMEIISIPLKGSLKHQDNTGGQGIIKSGEVQIMSAGSGLAHSEFNASQTEPVNFLQIWIFPKIRNINPRYDQKTLDPAHRVDTFQTIVSPDQSDDKTLWINQDAWLSLANLNAGFKGQYTIKKSNNGVYAFVIDGSPIINGEKLGKRDGLGVWETSQVTIEADKATELLLIDVPMQAM